jgi:beta-glucanase (GH16 family)
MYNRLTFEEQCSAPLDEARWRTEMIAGQSTFRSWGQRADWMADENVTVEDGLCVITAEDRATGDRPFTSGVMSTGGFFEQLHGRFEARIQAPSGVGFWPVLWLRDVNGWPPAIHIANLDGGDPNAFSGGYWYFDEAGARASSVEEVPIRWSNEFHVYSVEWTPGEIALFVDGNEWFRGAEGAAQIASPLHVVVNLSIHDGDAGAPPDATTPWPARLLIDWIRVYAE